MQNLNKAVCSFCKNTNAQELRYRRALHDFVCTNGDDCMARVQAGILSAKPTFSIRKVAGT